MPHRFDGRLRRLEQQDPETTWLHGKGLAALLAYARAQHIEVVPIADLTDAELDAKITALTGTNGLSLLLREALEEERTRRQGAQGKDPLA